MKYIAIEVPDYNDAFSRVALDGRQYLLRTTYNASADRWSFGLYDMQKSPIVQGIRIVPKFPLNLHVVDDRMPNGLFGAVTRLDAIGRRDFLEGRAAFVYVPLEQ